MLSSEDTEDTDPLGECRNDGVRGEMLRSANWGSGDRDYEDHDAVSTLGQKCRQL